jgi:transcriptional regulator with XRE-family HTH domain
MDYGKALRIARAFAGLQQKELAALARIDPSHVSLMEDGKRNPSSRTMQRLATALQIPELLLRLLAAEPEDLDLQNPQELQSASDLLAQLLLRHFTRPGFPRSLPSTTNTTHTPAAIPLTSRRSRSNSVERQT